MNLLFLHLSDIHIAKRADGYAINIEKIIQALNIFDEVDECIIIVSGDITNKGGLLEFKVAGDMMGNLVNQLKKYKFKQIKVFVVPGNHDLELTNNNRSFDDIVEAVKTNEEKSLINNDLKSLENFYKYARRNECFDDDKIISQKRITFNGFNINFTLINTAIFSLLGGNNQDMGIHYLNDENIANLVPKVRSDLNIAIMHHSYEWFKTPVKEQLRDILGNNFSIVFEGHEHDGFGEHRRINNISSISYVQGNSLSGDQNHSKGFGAIIYNTSDKSVKGYSFLWNNDYYKPTQILDEFLKDCNVRQFKNRKEFIRYLNYDDNHRFISQYFVFPSMSYNKTNEENEIETIIINDLETFVQTIDDNDKIIVAGESKAGKSTLAKIIYQHIINGENGIVPLLFVSDDLQNKKIHRIVEYAFKEQYQENDNSYDKFLQLGKRNRIAIMDGAGKISKIAFERILELFDKSFCKVIILSEDKIDLDIPKRVVDALTEKKVERINIRPFLYDKRKELISKVYSKSNLLDDNSKQTIDSLNNMISSQVRYFRLDPEFIINFVERYSEKYRLDFTSKSSIFSMVYENSIKERIIKNVQSNEVNGLFRSMCEIAYKMHFDKNTWISIGEVSKIIEIYNKEFRQNVKISTFLETGEKSNLIIEKESKIKFKDNNLLAYFVAQALNIKYFYEDITGKIKYLLDNLCFGINSDIVLFISLITNNPNIINVVLDCASNHFKNLEELNFDLNNIPFLCQANFKVKNTIPDEKEKMEEENQLIIYEEELKAADIVELIDLYDYNEKDIEKIENKMIKSIKYVEILSKILPAFSHNMKAEQQDSLVQAIYSFPNCFVFQLLSEIKDDYDLFIENLCEKISEIRKEKNIAELHVESVKKMLEQMSISLVVSLYQLVASAATTNQTIKALNSFDFNSNSNYSIMNLMMTEKTTNQKAFCEKAIKLYDKSKIKLVKSMVKFTARNFFLHHDISFIGETQSLLDRLFGSSESYSNSKKKIKDEIIIRKIMKTNHI
ncbi:MAG: metallophosphoesterase [Clostridia bacterium]|nr:metallophosphoesterase [Clostridia bacterium]